MANGDDLINAIIAIADMIGAVAKGIKKLKSIYKKKASKLKTLKPTI